MNKLKMLAMGVLGGNVYADVAAPDAAFSWLPFVPQKLGANKFRLPASWSLASYANIAVSKTYWVKPAAEGGSDTASGADEAHAFATFGKALSKTDVDRIYVKAGIYGVLAYPTVSNWANASPARSIAVIGYGGQVISSSSVFPTSLTWGAVNTHYEATYSSTTISRVYDASVLDANGDYTKLTLAADAAGVESTPGTYYYANPTIYVHTSDARQPDANIFCFTGAPNGSINDAVTYYIEGISFYGGSSNAFNATSADPNSKLYLKNCEFKYTTGDCLTVAGMGEVIVEDCVVARCEADGIHIATSGAQAGNLVLINTISRNNGPINGTNSNGYSRHGPGSTVGINCTMHSNWGPNMKDITTGTTTWLMGWNCHDPQNIGTAENYGLGDTTAAPKMWLDGCISGGTRLYDLVCSANATIYLRTCTPATMTVTGGGTVTTY